MVPIAPVQNDGDGQSHHRAVLALLWAGALLLLFLVWSHIHVLSGASAQRDLDTAERDLANLTRLSQEHAVRTFRSADQVIRFVQSRYLELGNKLDLASLTRGGVIDTEIFNQISVIDAKGMLVVSDQAIQGHVDLSDREHFKVHVANDSGQLFVSKPLIGRTTHKWSIQLTRRINRPDGSFGGVVVLSIDPSYFDRFYGELNLGPGGMTALYGLDGIARVRHIGAQTEYSTDASRSVLFARLVHEHPAGSFIQNSVVDGIERMYYYRTLPQVGMLVLAGIDIQFLKSNHQQEVQALYVQAGLVSLLILALAAGMTRYLQVLRSDGKARRRAQELLQDRKEQLDAVFEISPDGFVSFDRQQRVKFINPAFRQMTGLGSRQVDGMSAQDFSEWLAEQCDVSTPFMGLAALRRAAEQQSNQALDIVELKDRGHPVLQMQLRLSESGSVSQILCVRDISHETEVEALKGEFMATAAHELRTPMASIYGFAEVLLTQNVDTESQKEFLGIIYKQSRQMVDILNELLDLTRMEARRGKDFKYARVHLQDLLTELIRAFQRPSGRSPPELKTPQQPIFLWADAGKLRQALLNVVSNAYKYSPDGGAIRIVIEPLDGTIGNRQVAIRIADHGIGMTQEQVSKVFTRFYRADTSGQVPGTGLGMSITKEIVEHHKGRITILSVPGAGSEFSILLPVDDSSLMG